MVRARDYWKTFIRDRIAGFLILAWLDEVGTLLLLLTAATTLAQYAGHDSRIYTIF